MSRALKFSLFIGAMVSITLAAVYAPGGIRPLDAAVARKLGLAGVGLSHPVVQSLAFAGLAFGIAWTTIGINRPLFKWLVAGLALAEVFTLFALVTLFSAFFSPVLPAAAIMMAFAGGFFYSRSQAGQRQRLADTAFGSRVSSGQMRTLVDGSAPLDPAGQLQVSTIVVAEIFNHQALMDALEPGEYAAVSNRFYNTVAEALVEKGGTLAACDGEGVRVLFGAPLPVADHAPIACRATLEAARQVRTLNGDFAGSHDGLTCDVRFGINSGDMAVGYFGARRLGGFGAAGEEVAFARRLCAANLIYGSTVLIGARTFEMAEASVEARPLELLRRRLGDSWLEVYELLGEPHDLTPEEMSRRDLFWTGVIFYREKRLADALAKFSQARPPGVRPDEPLEFYIHRIKQLQHGSATADFETARLINSL